MIIFALDHRYQILSHSKTAIPSKIIFSRIILESKNHGLIIFKIISIREKYRSEKNLLIFF